MRMRPAISVCRGASPPANAMRARRRRRAAARLDRRSGALFHYEESGVETPYLAEHGGPVEWVMRHDRAMFDDGAAGPARRA